MENIPDPLQYPKVKIGDEEYEVRFRAGDIIRMHKAGIRLESMTELKGIEAMETVLTVLSYGIAHAVKMSTEAIADKIDFADIATCVLAIKDSLGKAAAQATTAAAARNLAPAKTDKVQ